MQNLVYKENHKFYINKELLLPEARTTAIINGLYAAIYEEFKGAIQNSKYSKLTPLERLEALNIFANNWAKQRGFI